MRRSRTTREAPRSTNGPSESPTSARRRSAPALNPTWERFALGADAEGEAERAADRVLNGRPAPPPPAQSALPDDVRARLWPTLGPAVDLARVHTDDTAARQAADLHARAFTSGADIGFARGAFRPDTDDGLRLLAHEVAHVAQHAAAGTEALHLKPEDPKPRAFYQDFEDWAKQIDPYFPLAGGLKGLDAAAYERKQRYAKLAELGHAIEDGRKEDARKLLKEYLELDKVNLFLGTMTDEQANEYAVRLFRLGLPDESARLRQHHGEQVKDRRIFDPDYYRRKLDFWTLLTDRTLATLDTSTAAKASASIDALVPSFAGVRDAILELDPAAVDSARRGYTPGSLERIHSTVLLHEFWDGLIAQLGKLFAGMQSAFQTILDAAVAALQSGDDGPLQDARKTLNDRLLPAVRVSEKHNVLGAMAKITKSTFAKGKGRYVDVFLTGKAAEKRSEKFILYDVTKEVAPEMEMSLDRVFQIRFEQVEFLAKLYGGRDAAGKVSDDSKRNAAVMKQLPSGKLELHSDDDWREFTLLKYNDLVKSGQSKGDALTAVIKLLESYFKAFTVHTPYNLEDIDTENYLGRDFPRALTGQLIQDCGVYALRVAYILTKVRTELGLRFRFVVMPVHLGLVITGEGLPTYIAQNGSFNVIDPKELAEIRKKWDAWKTTKKVKDPDNPFAEKEVPAEPEGKKDEDQFLGELTTQLFISGPLDMPFKVVDVPEAKGDAAAVKKAMWAQYKSIAPTELFGPESKNPRSPEYQFQLRYLGVLEEQRRNFNERVVPFWNVGAPERHKKLSTDLAIGAKEKKTMPGADAATALDTYVADVRKLMQPIDDADARIADTERAVGRTLRDEPRLQAKGTRIAYGLRTARFVFFQWRKDLDAHLDLVTKNAAAMKTQPEVETSSLAPDIKPPFPPGGDPLAPRVW